MPERPPARERSWLQRWGYVGLRTLARLACVVIFQFRCFGRANYPSTGGALLCANHQSFLDPALIGLTCDRRLNYLARSTLFRQPLRMLIEFLDAIPIEREGVGLSGLKETLRRLRRDELVLLFPEGTRTTDGRLAPFKPGFCAVARRSAVPLVPIAIAGAYDSWPRNARLPRPAKIHVVIGPPLSAADVRQLDDQQLVAELERRIRTCFDQARACE